MDEITVTYFMEDIAQEAFIRPIVQRIAMEEGIGELSPDVRCARGGYTMIGEFKNFIKDNKELLWEPDRILVVVRDSNCMGHGERLREMKAPLKEHGLGSDDRIAFGLPDPHIERWYVADQKAFNSAIGPNAAPSLPRTKCGKNYWKNILHKALQAAGIQSRSGGSEYGELIAQKINLQWLSGADAAFKSFYDELRGALKLASSGST